MSKRKWLFYGWVIFVVVSVALFLLNPTFANDVLAYLSNKSVVYLYVLIFLLGIVRSFTLIPVTYLIILGLLFLPPLPLYIIIMTGILVSSASVYFFFEYLHIDKMLNNKYQKQVDLTKHYLSKYELPVIVFWSMNPILPSDIICYVAGTLRVNFYKFMFGMAIGEGIMCGLYIFGGKYLLNLLFGIII